MNPPDAPSTPPPPTARHPALEYAGALVLTVACVSVAMLTARSGRAGPFMSVLAWLAIVGFWAWASLWSLNIVDRVLRRSRRHASGLEQMCWSLMASLAHLLVAGGIAVALHILFRQSVQPAPAP